MKTREKTPMQTRSAFGSFPLLLLVVILAHAPATFGAGFEGGVGGV